jgi:hypothetical protein
MLFIFNVAFEIQSKLVIPFLWLFKNFINMLKVGNIHDEPCFYMHGCNSDIKVEVLKHMFMIIFQLLMN